jgi:hypothetical protein
MTEDSDQSNKNGGELPAPEVLQSQTDDQLATPDPAATMVAQKVKDKRRRITYRPSHKATFIGLGVVIVILAINVVVIMFVINAPGASKQSTNNNEVTLSASALDKIGVSRNTVGSSGEELIVGPDARFNGKVTIAGDVSLAGQLSLNSKFTATDASLTNLQAGNTSLNQLNVNGDGTVSNLNIRTDLAVVGVSRLQGPVTLSSLLTVNNSINVAGNLAVGGTLSTRNFEASSLISDTTLTIGGHIITAGTAPALARGAVLRGTDTVSISGNDASGTVALNIGAGSIGAGCVAQIAFHASYASTPHVIISAVGASVGSIYVTRSSGGFSICIGNSLSNNGYAFDYIVMQ